MSGEESGTPEVWSGQQHLGSFSPGAPPEQEPAHPSDLRLSPAQESPDSGGQREERLSPRACGQLAQAGCIELAKRMGKS